MSLLKENSSQSMTLDTVSLPPRLGRKRRSSILKPQRPFADLQNVSRDESRFSKDRRVSFCPTIEVKEFHAAGSGRGTHGSAGVKQVQVVLPAAEDASTIQMSTPVKRKKRRISASQVGRLSIIPKLDKSFTFTEDDFLIFEDDNLQQHTPPATAPRDEITLFEELPDPQSDGVDLPETEDNKIPEDLNCNEPAPLSLKSQGTAFPVLSSLRPPDPASVISAVPVVLTDDVETLLPSVTLASTPTVHTLPIPSNSYYLAMATPDITDSPLRNQQLTAASSGGSVEVPGVASRDLAKSPVTHRPRGGSEPRSMDFTCLSTNISPSEPSAVASTAHLMSLTCLSTNMSPSSVTSAVADAECVPSATSLSTNMSPSSVTSAVADTECDPMSMTLTCMEIASAPGGSVDEGNEVPSKSPVMATMPDKEGPSVRLDSQQETVDSQMDITCTSDTLQTSTVDSPLRTAEDKPASNHPVEEQSPSSVPDVPPAGATDPPAGENPTSPVFKQPKRPPIRSQLKLKSSGRKVVKASPLIRTPLTGSKSLQRSQSNLTSHTPSLPHLALNSTYTVTPLQNAATLAPLPVSCTEEMLAPSSPLLSSSLPPHTSSLSSTTEPYLHMSTPPFLTSTSPTSTTAPPPTSHPHILSGPEEGIHSVLASPPLTGPSPIVSAPLHTTGSEWLKSPGDSFNLVTSEEDTQESLLHSNSLREQQLPISVQPPQSTATTNRTTPASVQQANPVQRSSCTQTPITHVDPVPSQPTRLAAALQQLRVSGAPTALINIETPESALVEVPPAQNESLHISALHVTMNDTTLGGRSMLLSPSVYDKFMVKICSEDAPHPATTSDCTSPPPHPRSLLEAGSKQVDSSPSQTIPPSCSPPKTTSSLSSPLTGPSSLSPTQLQNTTLFSEFLSDVISRLHDMLQGVQLRLDREDYHSTHHHLPQILDTWSRVLSACLGTLTTLEQYGELSRASHTTSWYCEGVPIELPLPPIGREDVDGGIAMKAEWILELIGAYNNLLPTAQLARDEAAMLYGWHFEEWTYDQQSQHITVSVPSKDLLHFQLSISDIISDRIASTSPIAQAVWGHMKDTPQTTPPVTP